MTDNILSISTGIIGDDKINCYKALEIGLASMNWIIGGDFGSVKFHKKDKVLSLKAVNSSVKIDNEVVTIDRTLIFQRISLNIQNKTDMNLLDTLYLFLTKTGCGKDENHHSMIIFRIFLVYLVVQTFLCVWWGFLLHKVRWDNKSI